jgi:hypothetical protein
VLVDTTGVAPEVTADQLTVVLTDGAPLLLVTETVSGSYCCVDNDGQTGQTNCPFPETMATV